MTEASRLRWLCRRGMKELDLVMTAYLEGEYPKASESDQNGFRMLLEMPDPDLYALLLGRQTCSSQCMESVAASIRQLSSAARARTD